MNFVNKKNFSGKLFLILLKWQITTKYGQKELK